MRVAAGFDRLQSNWKVKAKRTAPGTDRRSEWTRILLFATIGMDHHSLYPGPVGDRCEQVFVSEDR